MNKYYFFIFLFLNVFCLQSQNGITIKGKVLDSNTLTPIKSVIVSIENTNFTEITNGEGEFELIGKDITGSYLVKLTCYGYEDKFLKIEIAKETLMDLGILVMGEESVIDREVNLITILDDDLNDYNSGSETTTGLLQATKDVFQQVAAFNWGQTHFKIRGLSNEYSTVPINGISMNKLWDGRPQWNNWGGLNDMFKNQEFSIGSTPSDVTFGNLLGTQSINTRASNYRKGAKISFAKTNSNYNWRSMATYASGVNSKGIAYAFSFSKRGANESFYEGTNYKGNSFFFSLEKKFTDKSVCNYTFFFAENKRGMNSSNTEEVTQLAGVKYNSYWGWQNGEKRNSREKYIGEPIHILSHYWKINDKTNWNTSLAYQYGKLSKTKIGYRNTAYGLHADGTNSVLHDPTYYKNLPSFYKSMYENDSALFSDSVFEPGGLGGVYVGNLPENEELAEKAKESFLNHKQVDWDAIYKANKISGDSFFILYEDRTDEKTCSGSSVLNHQLTENVFFDLGISYKKSSSHNFQQLTDLLGGLYYLNTDSFGSGEEAQYDLNHPNRQVHEGDDLKYNYYLYLAKYNAFSQFKYNSKKIDYYLGQTFVLTDYQRKGKYRSGVYPLNSYGNSNKITFKDFGIKTGAVYKISGNKFLTGNLIYLTQAPFPINVFPNARVNNYVSKDLKSESVKGADINYIIKKPNFKSRLTLFYSKVENAMETSYYFAEGLIQDIESVGNDAFVVESVRDISKRNLGLEIGTEIQITSTLKSTTALALGEYIYTNNPNISIIEDSKASVENPEPVEEVGRAYLKNYFLSGSPQTAFSMGLEYRDPKFWWVGVNYNYLDKNYMDIAPILRTDRFVINPMDSNGFPFPETTRERVRELLRQQKLPSINLVNIVGGKSWKWKDLGCGFFVSINNVLDGVYKTGGYEQSREANYRELNQAISSGSPPFAPKYFYGFGRTYFVNIYLTF